MSPHNKSITQKSLYEQNAVFEKCVTNTANMKQA